MWPRRMASTVSATLRCTITLSRSTISTSTSNVGGALRSRPVFWVPRRRGSSPPRQPRPDRVEDDPLGHVVLDRLDHHGVLLGLRAHLDPAGVADARVGDVAVA